MRLRQLTTLLWFAFVLSIGCTDDTTSGGDVVDDGSGDTNGGEDSVVDATPDVPDVDDSADVAGLDTTDAPLDTLDPLPPGPWPVTEPGHYGVGYRELSVTYQPDGVDDERRLRLAVWYPTRATGGFDVAYLAFLQRENVFRNAEVAPDGPFPLLVFSHGSNGFAEQSYFMTEFFASHGWVVASPDHTGNTITELNEPLPPEVLLLRPQDVTAVIDKMQTLPDDELLAGAITDDIAVSGHSFGGYTSIGVAGAAFAVDVFIAQCAAGTVPVFFCDALVGMETFFRAGFLDVRVKAIIPQAPSTIAYDGGAAIDVPVLLVTGARDGTTRNVSDGDPFWRTLDGPNDKRVDFANGGHFTFSNACELAPDLGANDGCGSTFVDAEEAHQAVNAYALAFLRFNILDDTSAIGLLTGVETVSSDVTLSHK